MQNAQQLPLRHQPDEPPHDNQTKPAITHACHGTARSIRHQAGRWFPIRRALAAPSIYNTQPWRWNLVDETLQLRAERDRQLPVTDADARQLMISCGGALHHAVVALSAAGWQPRVIRLPDPQERALLAVIGIAYPHSPPAMDMAEYSAIHRRHTDRRAFTAEPVPAATLSMLTAAAGRRRSRADGRLCVEHLLPKLRVAQGF